MLGANDAPIDQSRIGNLKLDLAGFEELSRRERELYSKARCQWMSIEALSNFGAPAQCGHRSPAAGLGNSRAAVWPVVVSPGSEQLGILWARSSSSRGGGDPGHSTHLVAFPHHSTNTFIAGWLVTLTTPTSMCNRMSILWLCNMARVQPVPVVFACKSVQRANRPVRLGTYGLYERKACLSPMAIAPLIVPATRYAVLLRAA